MYKLDGILIEDLEESKWRLADIKDYIVYCSAVNPCLY